MKLPGLTPEALETALSAVKMRPVPANVVMKTNPAWLAYDFFNPYRYRASWHTNDELALLHALALLEGEHTEKAWHPLGVELGPLAYAWSLACNWQVSDMPYGYWDRHEEDIGAYPPHWMYLTVHREEQDLVDESNGALIQTALMPLAHNPHDNRDDIIIRSSYGSRALLVRMFDSRESVEPIKRLTPAFLAWFERAARIAVYPLLDEDHHSYLEQEAAITNIEHATPYHWRNSIASVWSEWARDVYGWLSDNKPAELENRSGQGAYPSQESLKAALTALNFYDHKEND